MMECIWNLLNSLRHAIRCQWAEFKYIQKIQKIDYSWVWSETGLCPVSNSVQQLYWLGAWERPIFSIRNSDSIEPFSWTPWLCWWCWNPLIPKESPNYAQWWGDMGRSHRPKSEYREDKIYCNKPGWSFFTNCKPSTVGSVLQFHIPWLSAVYWRILRCCYQTAIGESTDGLCFPQKIIVESVWSLCMHETPNLLGFGSNILFYGCETWLVKQLHENALKVLKNTCLQSILRINLHDCISNVDTRQICSIKRNFALMIKECQLKWLGHVLQKPSEYLPCQILLVEPLSSWKRRQGRQLKNWWNLAKLEIKTMGG